MVGVNLVRTFYFPFTILNYTERMARAGAPRKARAASRAVAATPPSVKTKPARAHAGPGADHLAKLSLKACLIARDAAFNLRDLLTHSSRMAFLTIKKGSVVPRHSHDSEQFSYCISGSLNFKIGEEELVLRAGELVEIPSNVPHEAFAAEDFTGIDVFSPIRADWRDGTDAYLRQQK